MDHACSLGGSEDTHFGSVHIDDGPRHFHPRVCRHDGLSKQLRVGRGVAQRCFCGGQSGNNFFARERHTDNACGRREDLVEDAVKCLCCGDAGLYAGIDSGLSSNAVGIACIHQHCSYSTTCCEQMSSAYGDWSCNDLILCEHRCCVCSFI